MANQAIQENCGVKVVELDHIVLRCRDLPRTLAFYFNVLNLREERRIDRIGLIQLRAGSSLLDLVPQEVADRGGRNMDHFCLRVDPFNAAAIQSYLREHGFHPGEVASRYGAEGQGPSIYVEDPEGNTVELKGPPV